MPGEWAQQDLVQKSAILQLLYSKIGELNTDDKEGLIGFLASCLAKKSTKEEIDTLFSKASKKELTVEEFEHFFESL